MYILDDKYLLSEDIFDKNFVCNLNACKGACCWEGEYGAPLDEDELDILKAIYPEVKPYITAEGIKEIEKQGNYIIDEDDEFSTPLIGEAGPCVYINYSNDGTAYCGIEKAYLEGKINWRKPVSCHLYPIRLQHLPDYIALNYEKWDICSAACQLGDELKVPVYRFLKDALVRRFGEDFYAKLDDMANFHYANSQERL
jgi:hypothetical protein